MNIKKALLIISVIFFSLYCVSLCGFFKKSAELNSPSKSEKISISGKNIPSSDIWCITFQLVWNDFSEKLLNGKKIEFEGANPIIADELNKKIYTKDLLSDNSYYIANGKINYSLKRKIERDIKKKFHEKSDIVDKINWAQKDSLLFYSMLKKDFTFIDAFERLDKSSFNKSGELVNYFGIEKKTKNALRNNVRVLFYNNPEEYAVLLKTKEKENVILFRTDKDNSFTNHYDYILKNMKIDEFGEKDILKVPDINADEFITYDELCGKKIIGTNMIISQAIQTIKFKMDNKGGKLKSEAAIAVMRASLPSFEEKPRAFVFDKPFILFLIEEGKDKPYFALHVKDTKYLVK